MFHSRRDLFTSLLDVLQWLTLVCSLQQAHMNTEVCVVVCDCSVQSDGLPTTEQHWGMLECVRLVTNLSTAGTHSPR